jgi:NAD(P)-dependent dehydrogenase (short-subunit alcohol dehydrogenase family)
MKATAGIQDLRQLDASMPFGRVSQPEDVPGAVRWIVTDRAAYETGEKINVFGGGQ